MNKPLQKEKLFHGVTAARLLMLDPIRSGAEQKLLHKNSLRELSACDPSSMPQACWFMLFPETRCCPTLSEHNRRFSPHLGQTYPNMPIDPALCYTAPRGLLHCAENIYGILPLFGIRLVCKFP